MAEEQGGQWAGLRRDKPQKSTTEFLRRALALGPGGSRARRGAVIEQGIHLGSLQPQTLAGCSYAGAQAMAGVAAGKGGTVGGGGS